MMTVPLWFIFVCVFFFGCSVGMISLFYDMRTDPIDFYERHLRYKYEKALREKQEEPE